MQWQEWQTGKQVQHSAAMGLGCPSILSGDTPLIAGSSRPRGSGPPEEFSFPPDAGSCGLLNGMTDGGIGPPPGRAAISNVGTADGLLFACV